MKIDNDIPIPPSRHTPGEIGTTLKQLTVGQSVWVDRPQKSVHGIVFNIKRKGWGFTTRAESGGVRIWCTKVPEVKP